ncbi:hypothetical protein M947_11535 [Sulfurimonas hongkongensis]|uniref:Epoxyqueuosine reductase QueH n=1 Tax=Sulfurimonas hongkongensis TaxID=1172190 RepID=T0JBW0_9BACT|nr:hypothetical protein M947_11535 [Sulfurimonas hongkongensis]
MIAVKGLEREREKGARCEVCFDRRFEVSAKKALELGEKKITTTLLVSPLKSQEQLKRSGDAFFKKYGVEFIALDYRSNGGTQDQSQVTKEEMLYRQDYCGCIYGLTMQREEQDRIMDEMFSPISNTTLPASIEERLAMYEKRVELEEQNIEYRIVKEKFLNYRVFNFKLTKGKGELIPAYSICYSMLDKKKADGRIEFKDKNINYFNRQEIKFIDLKHFNELCDSDYKNIKELIFNPPSFEKELSIRALIEPNPYSLSPIIVVEQICDAKLTISLDATTYQDTKEKLLII